MHVYTLSAAAGGDTDPPKVPKNLRACGDAGDLERIAYSVAAALLELLGSEGENRRKLAELIMREAGVEPVAPSATLPPPITKPTTNAERQRAYRGRQRDAAVTPPVSRGEFKNTSLMRAIPLISEVAE